MGQTWLWANLAWANMGLGKFGLGKLGSGQIWLWPNLGLGKLGVGLGKLGSGAKVARQTWSGKIWFGQTWVVIAEAISQPKKIA